MVNYRGSTGYGQKFADAIFGDQNGGEAKDVVAGVDAALAEVSVARRDRLGIEGGSYGGQLTNWIITQTRASRRRCPRPASRTSSPRTTWRTTTTISPWSSASFPHEGET